MTLCSPKRGGTDISGICSKAGSTLHVLLRGHRRCRICRRLIEQFFNLVENSDTIIRQMGNIAVNQPCCDEVQPMAKSRMGTIPGLRRSTMSELRLPNLRYRRHMVLTVAASGSVTV